MVWIHPEDLPGMTVEVVEAPAVHEPIILKFTGFDCSRFESCLEKVVDLRLAFERQGGQLLGEPGRVRDLLLGESLKFCVCEQHRVNIVRYHHASRRFIGELRVELEAKLLEERHRALEILHREVDENFPDHGTSPSIALVPSPRRPSFGRTHSAKRRTASSASGARPAIIWKLCSISGNTSSLTSTPACVARSANIRLSSTRVSSPPACKKIGGDPVGAA